MKKPRFKLFSLLVAVTLFSLLLFPLKIRLDERRAAELEKLIALQTRADLQLNGWRFIGDELDIEVASFQFIDDTDVSQNLNNGLSFLASLDHTEILVFWAWADVSPSNVDISVQNFNNLKSLQEIEIFGIPIGDDDLASMVCHPSIKSIKIPLTLATNRSMRVISQLTSLKALNISMTSVDDEGIKSLAHHSSIKDLNLSYTAITDNALEYVATIPNLSYLDLTGTRVTESAIANLRKQLPHCEVHQGAVDPVDAFMVRSSIQKMLLEFTELQSSRND